MNPLARFGRLIGWEESTGTGAIKAALGSVAHPSLGMQPSVTTSRVERIAYAETGEVAEIETRNTVYRWLEWEPIEHDGWGGEPQGMEHAP